MSEEQTGPVIVPRFADRTAGRHRAAVPTWRDPIVVAVVLLVFFLLGLFALAAVA